MESVLQRYQGRWVAAAVDEKVACTAEGYSIATLGIQVKDRLRFTTLTRKGQRGHARSPGEATGTKVQGNAAVWTKSPLGCGQLALFTIHASPLHLRGDAANKYMAHGISEVK